MQVSEVKVPHFSHRVTTWAVLASQAEAIIDRGETWPQVTKWRTGD